MKKEELLKQLVEEYGTDSSQLLKDLEDFSDKKNRKKQRVTSSEVALSLKDVSKEYSLGKTKVHALKNADFQITKGEIVVITGPSGSGKSTILNLIAGLDKPNAGSVHVFDTRVDELTGSELATFRLQNLGFVFQFFYLQPFLNLLTNVQVPTMFMDMPDVQRLENASKFIDAVGLGDRIAHLPKELSGGQMQRAAIARAMVNNPKIILADEPTGNLDSENADAVLALFSKVREEFGATVIVVTHDPRVANWADREIKLRDGRVL